MPSIGDVSPMCHKCNLSGENKRSTTNQTQLACSSSLFSLILHPLKKKKKEKGKEKASLNTKYKNDGITTTLILTHKIGL